MRTIRNIFVTLYLIAGLAVLAAFASLLTGFMADRVEQVLENPVARIAVLVCTGVAALSMLVSAIVAYAQRPDPTCVHPRGNPDIEVTLAALTSAARKAAPGEDDVLIESVEGRIAGRDRSEARLTIEAIAFAESGLEQLAARMQQRAEEACERMLGTPGVRVRVRFLPSKTTIVTKEV